MLVPLCEALGVIKMQKSVQLPAKSGFVLVENGNAFWVSFFVAPGIQNGARMGVKWNSVISKGSKMMNKRMFKKCRKKVII